MAKATVQAALGPVILRRLSHNKANEGTPDEMFAKTIQLVCILSILVTAPIGAILISITGPRLLTKTKPMQNVEGNVSIAMSLCSFRSQTNYRDFFFTFVGWRRSHRPSLYDISIIDEKEEREDPELDGDIETNTNTNTNASTTPNALRAVFTIGK